MKNLIPVISLNAAMATLVGCSSQQVALPPPGSFPTSALYAYVANAGGDVSVFSVNTNGALTPAPGSPFAAGSNPISVAIDSSGRR